MNPRNMLTVYRKELRDTLRDRRTLISMVVIPTQLMPALVAAIPKVMLLGGENSPQIRAALAANRRLRLVPIADNWRQLISDRKIRAVLEIPPGFDAALTAGEPTTLRIYNHEGEMRSRFASGELRRFFFEFRERLVAARLAENGLPANFVRPFELRFQNVAPPEKVGGSSIGGIIPYFLLLLSFTGAMYTAMDLTAGEKERGTMETILCSPVARIDLVLGKFLMVLTAALGTVAFSLLSMGLALAAGGTFLARAGPLLADSSAPRMPVLPVLDPLGLLAVVGMVIPMAVLFAAGLLTVSLFAKSFKEAQTYVSPLIILILLPAAIGLLPGVELNNRLALVPILNVSLVSKELVSGVWPWHQLVLIFGSSCLYAAGALALAVRMFNREDVIFRA
jgi:sodium transport system permease protein